MASSVALSEKPFFSHILNIKSGTTLVIKSKIKGQKERE